jgi:hypothetical protein
MMERVNQVDRYRFGDVGNKEVVLHKVMSSALGCGLNAAAELLRHDGIRFLSFFLHHVSHAFQLISWYDAMLKVWVSGGDHRQQDLSERSFIGVDCPVLA